MCSGERSVDGAPAAPRVSLAVVLEFFHFHVSSFASLGVICALLAAGTLASLHHNRQQAAEGLKVSENADDGFKSIDVV